MQQIQNGETETIRTSIYRNGSLINADGAVTVTVYDADDSSNTVIVTGSATNEPPLGVYAFELSASYTSLNRILRVVWSYSVNSVATSTTSFIEVATPYATVADIVDFYGYGTKPSDPNYKPENQITSMEKLARTVIEGYTGQKFGKRAGYQEVFGDGSDACWLTEPMLQIDKIYENGLLVQDNTVNPVFNNFGYTVELTQTNKTVRIVNPGWDVRYDNQVDPTVLNYGRFRANSRYRFDGIIGWNYVPQDIKLAAQMLVGDYLANDAAWRAKYLKKVSMSEVEFEMKDGAYNGTGNLFVDNILDQYRTVGIVII